jgi:hypothetical protein
MMLEHFAFKGTCRWMQDSPCMGFVTECIYVEDYDVLVLTNKAVSKYGAHCNNV